MPILIPTSVISGSVGRSRIRFPFLSVVTDDNLTDGNPSVENSCHSTCKVRFGEKPVMLRVPERPLI